MIHVCFGLYDKTGHYSKFTGTTMLSIFANTKSEVTVHILHDDTLTQANRDKFSAVAKQYNQRVEFYNVEEICADKLAEYVSLVPAVKTAPVTVGAFYRLVLTEILSPDIDKVIYLDSDIVVNLDITELWKIELGDKIFAAVPEAANGMLLQKFMPLCLEGYVKPEDYFNSGVLLMNLNILRGEGENLKRGVIFRGKRNNGCFDQDILNYLFAADYIKLPVEFNCFVKTHRHLNNDAAFGKIYHYTYGVAGRGLTLDMQDPFNRLWMEYFAKTPWFTAEAISRLCAGFRQVYFESNLAMIKLTATMSGKARAFVVPKDGCDAIKELFAVRDDEEVITADKYIPLQEIFEQMNSSRGKKIFFIFVHDFPFENFERLGFVRGKDFLNALGLVSNDYGFQPKSHAIIKAM